VSVLIEFNGFILLHLHLHWHDDDTMLKLLNTKMWNTTLFFTL